jgi:methyl-accepting chemotaxis protein
MVVMRQKRVMPYLVAVLAAILLLLGWVGVASVNRLTDTTLLLYEHPFTVTTAVLRIHANLLGMNRSMKDAVLADSAEDMEKYRHIVDEREGKILDDFLIVEKYFLGEPAQVQAARQAFFEWKPIRDEVLQLRRKGRRQEAGMMSQTVSNRQVEEIEGKISRIQEFAEGKATAFRVRANEIGNQTSLFVLLSCITALILAGVVFRKAIHLENKMCELNDQLDNTVKERTLELANANDKLSGQNKEMRFMNDELTAQNEEMRAMNEEIISLNDNLATMNDNLEKRVEERTSELACAHQEVSAQCEELVHMEDQLRKLNETLEQQVAERTLQLEVANKELAGFNYSVAHDLRAPIRHITGFIEILKSEAADRLDATSRDYLQRISDASTKLGQMVDHLLEFSQAGREKPMWWKR